MESTAELQESELTVLKSIYGEDFIECPPPKAWKVRGLSNSSMGLRAER